MAKGPTFIVCIIRLIQLHQQVLALDLQMGLEIKIPKDISSYALPTSFRFYESIVSVVRDMIDLEKTEKRAADEFKS